MPYTMAYTMTIYCILKYQSYQQKQIKNMKTLINTGKLYMKH